MLNLLWDALSEAFTAQQHFSHNYSPLYEAIFEHAASILKRHAKKEPLDVDERALIILLEQTWQTRSLKNGTEATLLLTAAIHASVLNEDAQAEPISRFFETVGGSYEPDYDKAVLWQMLCGLYMRPSVTLVNFLREGYVQTNEVSRGAVWLLPLQAIHSHYPHHKITLIDLGCSAGLNLIADQLSWQWKSPNADQWRSLGEPPLLISQRLIDEDHANFHDVLPYGALPALPIHQRIGVDLHPLNIQNEANVLTLRACIWGDQPERLARLDKAIGAFQDQIHQLTILQGDMIEVAYRLPELIDPETQILILYNTAVTLYFNDGDYYHLQTNIARSFNYLQREMKAYWIEHESPRLGESITPDKTFPIKIHRMVQGKLEKRYFGYAEPHIQSIHVMADWKNAIHDG